MRTLTALALLVAALTANTLARAHHNDRDFSTLALDQALANDLPVPAINQPGDEFGPPADNPAYCDEIGYAVTFRMVERLGWGQTSSPGACFWHGKVQMFAACGAPEPIAGRTTAEVPCLVLFFNNRARQFVVYPEQFELLEASGRPWRPRLGVGASPTYLDPGAHAVVPLGFPTTALPAPDHPFLLRWWPPFRPPSEEPQALTVVVHRWGDGSAIAPPVASW